MQVRTIATVTRQIDKVQEEIQERRDTPTSDRVTLWSELEVSAALAEDHPRRSALAVKGRLRALAKNSLPSLVGERYTSVAIACLCCLDEDSEVNSFRYEKNLEDKNGIIVGVRYIENVSSLASLSRMSCRYDEMDGRTIEVAVDRLSQVLSKLED
ncbi:hypothetical protein BJX64DRAFT_293233 [Aspergillus heterothallicus]